MRDDLIRRTLIFIPQLLLVTFITFLFINLAPGDILAKYRFDPRISPQTVEKIEKKFHFDKPAVVQYGYWLWRLCHLDLGYSFSREANVTAVIAERMGNTLLMSSFARHASPGSSRCRSASMRRSSSIPGETVSFPSSPISACRCPVSSSRSSSCSAFIR